VNRKGYSIFQRNGTGPYYVTWTDGSGKRITRRASANRKIADEIGRAKAAEADRVRGGVIDHAEAKAAEAGRSAVAAHVEKWKGALREKRRTPKHVSQQAKRVAELVKRMKAVRLSDITTEAVQTALANVADDHSERTANHYLTALRTFVRWCCKTNRLAADPLVGVDRYTAHEPTFRRTAINPDALAKLFVATETRTAKTPVSGRDRAMYYRVMAYTGLRKSEAASLTPESFRLEEDDPGVTVEAAYSKRRRRDSIPLKNDLVPVLRTWLATKPANRPVFRLPKWMNLERVFRNDCKAAGIVAAEGERLGVHSLRRFFITSVVRAGGLAVGQDLARHSTPMLTKAYVDLDIRDHMKGIDGLPNVGKKESKQERRIG
jgi:integrase